MENNYSKPLNVVLADDDEDDRMFFKDALIEIKANVNLQTVRDGEELIRFLINAVVLPEIVFLDLNMPRKNGFECIAEIRRTKRLNDVFLIVYSTAVGGREIDETFNLGANLFINKSNGYNDLKNILIRFFQLDLQKYLYNPEKSKFVLSVENTLRGI